MSVGRGGGYPSFKVNPWGDGVDLATTFFCNQWTDAITKALIWGKGYGDS